MAFPEPQSFHRGAVSSLYIVHSSPDLSLYGGFGVKSEPLGYSPGVELYPTLIYQHFNRRMVFGVWPPVALVSPEFFQRKPFSFAIPAVSRHLGLRPHFCRLRCPSYEHLRKTRRVGYCRICEHDS